MNSVVVPENWIWGCGSRKFESFVYVEEIRIKSQALALWIQYLLSWSVSWWGHSEPRRDCRRLKLL